MLYAKNFNNINQPTPDFYTKFNGSATDVGVAPTGVPTIVGGVSYVSGKTGVASGAVTANGTTGRVEYNDLDKFSFTSDVPFTISFWAKVTNPDVTTVTEYNVVGKIEDGAVEWRLMYNPSEQNIILYLLSGNSTAVYLARGLMGSKYIVNQWHHYCFVYRGSKTIDVWFDGLCVASGLMSETGTYVGMTNTAAKMRFFYDILAGFTGGIEIDEFKIFKNKALSAAEVRHEYMQLESKFNEQLVLRTTKNGTFTTTVTNTGGILEFSEGGVTTQTNSFSKDFTGLGNTIQVNATKDWSGVTNFYCSNQGLTGDFPKYFCNLLNLNQLGINNNQFSGTIPSEIGNLTKLRLLYLRSNQFSGTIPTEIGNLTELQYLHLYTNQFSGTIPTEIGNLTKLLILYLQENQLTGSIPASVSNFSFIQVFQVSSNQLTGTIPTFLATKLDLTSLWLNSNLFTQSNLEAFIDAIPLTVAPSLRTILLQGNTGSAAVAVSRATRIALLNSSYNYLITI